MPWDPAQYMKFADHRLRPALDLLDHVPLSAPAEICDLGAGTGNVTRQIKSRWPAAHVTGVDDSEEMLARASEAPDIDWERADLGSWAPRAAPDLIYSNAALHWLPRHERVFPRLVSYLAPDGVLAAQMPRNFTAPSHALVDEAVRSGPWRERLEHLIRPSPTQEPAFYYDLLAPITKTLDIWETEYLHVLSGPDPVKEWLKGSWLQQFLAELDEPMRGEFEACYGGLVRKAYPQRSDGHTLLPFRRLFIVATI
ncbi:MAG TPA: methyltransferase domain-containing protein [Chloroflexota bacterium]|nr:methyltransferase domain-containing protein [Chloroflexota bacterium]